MKIAVCVKQAIDETELRLDPSGRPVFEGAPSKISTFDKNAVEEAIRLKSGSGGEVTVFTVGGPDAKKTMKEALAMGADKGVLILGSPGSLDSSSVARLLSSAIKRAGGFDLVICSEGSSDIYTGQVPPMIGEILGLPYVGYAKKVELSGQSAKIERALEDSVEAVESPLPMALSVVSEINEPRYPTLIQIMQASKKPIEEVESSALGEAGNTPKVEVVSMSAQPMNRKHVMFEGTPDEAAAKLVGALEKEGLLSR